MAILSSDENIRGARIRVEGNSFGGVDQEYSVLRVWEADCGISRIEVLVRSSLAYGATAGEWCCVGRGVLVVRALVCRRII